ncbi:hypothetical protein TIFTF001_011561 [Ficus carica]|uniref:Pyrrolo-quinoline quinone repeat domain-containing protein n=1 Tax=Ficus carica TaxID=3494 RepID=A0AA88ALZ2_FICCA|nr:hypothetical protein TIFTF001_011561 [Ficus carica]
MDKISQKGDQDQPGDRFKATSEVGILCRKRYNSDTGDFRRNPLYFPGWNGYFYAVNASEGSLVWKSNLQNLRGLKPAGFVFNVNWTVSRATPAVTGDDLLIVSIYGLAVVIAVKRSTGDLVWSTQLGSNVAGEAGPGGAAGGGYWGAATDEKRVYTNIANSGTKNFTLKPSAKSTTAGGWGAMDARSGRILWSTADPSNAIASGPVSVANGVLFAGSTNKQDPIYTISAKTGRILWSYATGATVYGGVSVSDGCFYVGNGYSFSLGAFLSYTSGTSLFAFCIP